MRYSAALIMLISVTGSLAAQADAERRLADLERRLNNTDNQVKNLGAQVNNVAAQASKSERQASDAAPFGFVAFLYGVFCALWAQNSGRSAWLWFFLGLFFSIFTVIVLLAKNANDRKWRLTANGSPSVSTAPAGASPR
jgi:hypothetical protein